MSDKPLDCNGREVRETGKADTREHTIGEKLAEGMDRALETLPAWFATLCSREENGGMEMQMPMAEREKLLKAGFYPVDADYWLYIGKWFKSEEDRIKYNWARRNCYTQEIMPYSEAYLVEKGAEEVIQIAFLHETRSSQPDPWREMERTEICSDGQVLSRVLRYKNVVTEQKTIMLNEVPPKDAYGKFIIDPDWIK
jgi:hypothetical protein